MDEERKYSFQTGERNTFAVLDYVLFGLLLCVSAGIGLFYAIKDRRKQTTKDFLLAGGNMNAIPVALSLLASFMSAITLLGTPSEMYNYTTMYWWIGLGYFFTIGAAAHIYIPIFYRLRVTSVYQYLEMRFGRPTRSLVSIIYVVQMVLYMSIVLYAPSLAMNAVTGFTLWGSVWAVGLVCIFYTTIGGMKAVLWTDTFQVGIMLAGLVTILIQGSIEVGGFAKAWQYSVESGRILFDDFNADPIVRHSFWSCVFGGAITWLAVYGANQAQIQRAITCPTLRKAQIAYWVNFPGLCIILYLCCFIGTVTYAFYRTCDPKTFGLISAADQLFPLFVMDVLGKMPGIPGIFVSCIFSGALSTLSSGLNSIAAVLLEDVVKVFCVADIDERRATNASKLIALVSGFICLGLTYVASMLGGVLQAALALFGMLGGPILGVFTLGIIFPWANQKGALTAVSSGLIFMLWIGVGYQVHKPPVSTFSTTNLTGCNWNLTRVQSYTNFSQPLNVLSNVTVPEYSTWDPFVRLYSLSYLWYSATAMLYVVSVGLIVSFATGRTDPKTINPKLMCPIFDVFMPFLPEKIRKPLRLGVDYSKMNEPAEEATGDEVEVFMDKRGQEMADVNVNGIPS